MNVEGRLFEPYRPVTFTGKVALTIIYVITTLVFLYIVLFVLFHIIVQVLFVWTKTKCYILFDRQSLFLD